MRRRAREPLQHVLTLCGQRRAGLPSEAVSKHSLLEEQRALECDLRRRCVAFGRWRHHCGESWALTAKRLGLSGGTLRAWNQRWLERKLQPHPRGRPPEQLDRETRQAVFAVLHLMGPELGMPTLQELFPEASRAALKSYRERCRRALLRGQSRSVYALHWTSPGSVWAMDYSKCPMLVDGEYRHLFIVRDLASEKQLEALPSSRATGLVASTSLERLFAAHGAPLVIKCDNGSSLIGEDVRAVCDAHGVLLLISPPQTPRYNGAVEAGIGRLKTRAHYAAARHSRTARWSCDDIEEARRTGNAVVYQRDKLSASPDTVWAARVAPSSAERKLLRGEYWKRYERERELRGLAGVEDLPEMTIRSIDRAAISRALVALGYLEIRRRRIPQVFSRRKPLNIT